MLWRLRVPRGRLGQSLGSSRGALVASWASCWKFVNQNLLDLDFAGVGFCWIWADPCFENNVTLFPTSMLQSRYLSCSSLAASIVASFFRWVFDLCLLCAFCSLPGQVSRQLARFEMLWEAFIINKQGLNRNNL